MAGQTGHELLQRLSARAGVPAGAHLQVADRCNHACRHCYQVQGRKGEMSGDELRAVIDDLAASGIMLLNISGGEALLRDDLLDIVRYARGKGFAVRLFTNAYLMTPAIARELASVGLLGVDVSVYSDEAAQHDEVTRVPGSHERTIAGVRALLAEGIRVHLKAPATSIVPDAGARVRRLAVSLGGLRVVDSIEITPMETGDLATCALSPEPDLMIENGALTPWSPPADVAAATAEARTHPSCGACRDGVAILPNGELRPCTDIVAPLGNLREKRFLEIYRGAGASLVRDLTWADVHGCRDCDLLAGCTRCHASAANEGGDLLGPYAAACAATVARYRAGSGGVRFAAPAAGCEPDREPHRGPFRVVSSGVLQAIPDLISPADDERRRRFEWVRPGRDYLESMSFGAPGTTAPAIPARRRLPLVPSSP